ncbi:MAG: FAD-dependent oxidoreductase [Clostridia bacterium]|nr:FAD-dependent oxidoreductase [Clostridia bacterium]
MKKCLAMLLALLMVAGMIPLASAEEVPFEKTVDWDAEYDVVVVGLGAAGCATAITAAQEGAKVLVLEKAPEGHVGGNSAICAQWAAMVDDKEQATVYMQSMREGFQTPTDEMIDVYLTEIMNNEQWLKDLGGPNVTRFERVEFPDMDGAGGIFCLTIDGNNGLGAGGIKPSGRMYKFLKNKAETTEGVTIWYESPAVHLVQDKETRMIHGVEATIEGQSVLVRARGGVVLCCGGYESNARMLEDYNDVHDSPSLGYAIYNTGDGIQMALEVGARLWHMANIVGPNTGYRFETDAMTFGASAGVGMLIGGDGTIYKAIGRSGHGKTYFYGTRKLSLYPQRSFAIFDADSVGIGTIHNSFSEGNKWEIEHGYFTVADTLEELAAKIDVPVEAMLASVESFNASAEHPIKTGPFYSCAISHCVGNTQGGPERGLGGEVIDVYGNPIPHLYEAGELGDIWSHCYQASCNIGGGLAFGRITARNAVAGIADTVETAMPEGKAPYVREVGEIVYEAGENQYIGKGEGKSTVPIVVRVTVDGEDIKDIEVLESWETPGFSARAFDQTISQIIEKDQPYVDIIGGATMTSVGIQAAVADALAQK